MVMEKKRAAEGQEKSTKSIYLIPFISHLQKTLYLLFRSVSLPCYEKRNGESTKKWVIFV